MTVSGILFDLEGVLLQAKTYQPLPFAKESINFCREQGIPFGIITNNTVQRPESLLEKIREHDLGVENDQLLTPLKFLAK